MRVALAALLVSLSACSPHDEDQSSRLGEELYIPFGGAVTIESESLTLIFKRLEEDSRCPTGAQCPSAGQATITVVVSKPGMEAKDIPLTLPGANGNTVSPYAVVMLQLDPYPTTPNPPTPEEYVATLMVHKIEE